MDRREGERFRAEEARVEEEVRRLLVRQPLNDFVPLQLIGYGSESARDWQDGFNS